jgi:flagellar basal-body rod protein FlgF
MGIGNDRRRSSDHDGATYAASRPNFVASIFSSLDFQQRRELADIRLSFDESVQGARFSYRKSKSKVYVFFTSDFWLASCNLLRGSMDQISIIAASGMRSSMQSFDLLANNIANASTSGYKGDSEFHTVFTSEAADADGADAPVTLPMIQRHWTDFSQGLLEPTNNPLDFGLSGKGFFVVKGPAGPLYTRNGNFRMAPDGTLVTSDGYALLDQAGQALKANNPAQPVEVSMDGSVHQNGQVLGQVHLVDFKDSSTLFKQGNNYYQNSGGQDPVDAAEAQIYQGKVEASNVNAAHGAVRLVNVMRHFEMMQKAISISNDMGRQAIEQVAKI